MSTEADKAIVVVFDVPGMTAEQYDRVIKDLEATGEGRPKGRLYHVASPKPGGWFVVDVWESPELLDRFAKILMPILQAAGVTPPQPQISRMHNSISG